VEGLPILATEIKVFGLGSSACLARIQEWTFTKTNLIKHMARKEEIDWKSKYDREHAIRVAAEELIEQKSLELFEAQLSIEKYAEKLEYEQKEMQDSIRYGARILNRLLPNEYIIQSSFPSSRVFLRPGIL